MNAPSDALPARVLQLGLHWFTQRAGGLDRYVAGLTTHRPATVQTRVLALRASDDDAGVPDFVQFYARATESPSARRSALRAAFERSLREFQPQVIASHFAQVAHPVRGRPSADAPHVVHFHGPWADESAREGAGRLSVFAKRWIERGVYRRADRIICLSNAFARVLIEGYGIEPSRVAVIPGGVDTRRFDPPVDRRGAREQLGWHPERPTVVCVRRLVRRMGLETLIDATASLKQALPDLSLKICGKGPLRDELASRIRSAGLDDHVTLCGFVPDEQLPLVYRAADLSIVPTESLEGFGLTTLESLAAGTACLVTPVGGLPEAVSGLSQALVIGGTDVRSIADALHTAVRDGSRLPTPESCHRYVLNGFDWRRIAERVHRSYASGTPSTRSL